MLALTIAGRSIASITDADLPVMPPAGALEPVPEAHDDQRTLVYGDFAGYGLVFITLAEQRELSGLIDALRNCPTRGRLP